MLKGVHSIGAQIDGSEKEQRKMHVDKRNHCCRTPLNYFWLIDVYGCDIDVLMPYDYLIDNITKDKGTITFMRMNDDKRNNID